MYQYNPYNKPWAGGQHMPPDMRPADNLYDPDNPYGKGNDPGPAQAIDLRAFMGAGRRNAKPAAPPPSAPPSNRFSRPPGFNAPGGNQNPTQYVPPQLQMPNWAAPPPPKQNDSYGDAQRRLAGSSAYQPDAWQGLQRPDDGAAQSSIDRLGQHINLSGAPQVGGFDAPDRVGDYQGLPGQAPSRDSADEITRKLMGGFAPTRQGRVGLDGPSANNEWERLGLDAAREGAGRDPGQQFRGQDVDRQVFNEGDINMLAGRAAAPTIRAYRDAQGQIAEAAARGGYADPSRQAALNARAAIEGAGAMGAGMANATIAAKQANAQQQAISAANARENFGQDMSARLGLGQLGLGRMEALGGLGTQRRGLDQSRDIAGAQLGVQQRGQDIDQEMQGAGLNASMLGQALSGQTALRGQDIGYQVERGQQGLQARGQDVTQREQDISAGLTQRGQDINQRQQDLEQSYRQAGLNAEQARAAASAALQLRGQDMDFTTQQGQQSLAARGQNIQAGVEGRQQDINAALGLGNLGLGQNAQGMDQYRADLGAMSQKYGTDVGSQNLQAELQSRMTMLDRQLQQQNLDSQSRAQLERERMQLERDLQASQLAQQGGQFQQQLGQQAKQFESDLGLRRDALQQGGHDSYWNRIMQQQMAGMLPGPDPGYQQRRMTDLMRQLNQQFQGRSPNQFANMFGQNQFSRMFGA